MSVQLTGESMQKKESNFEFGFFKLENNHDKAVVRFLHENYEDFSRRPVHFVKVPDQKYSISINCLRADKDSVEKCPFCSADVETSIVSKRSKRIYVEFLVYKILDKNNKVIEDYMNEPKRMVWERPRMFDDKVFSLSSRYNPLDSKVFQVERIGEKASTETTYDIYSIDVNNDEYKYSLPEKVYNPDGIQVLDKTADEMNYYLENNHTFPPKEEEGVERRSDTTQRTSTDTPKSNVEQSTQPAPVVAETQPVRTETVTQEQQPVQQTVSRRRSI